MSVFKKIFLLWFFYLLSINIYVWFLALLGVTPVTNLKELLFGVWGYGWDGMHYLRIATLGYKFPLQAFFPLYPLLIKFFHVFLPLTLSYRINALLLLPTLFVIYFLALLIGFKKNEALKALVVFLLFPTGFFLQANYAETLYILVSGLGLISILKKKYFLAAFLAGILSSVKITGISLGIIVIVSFILENKKDIKSVFKLMGIGLLSFAGLFAYFYFLNLKFGTFEIFFRAQEEWGRGTGLSFYGFFGYLLPIYRLFGSWDAFRKFLELIIFVFALFMLKKTFHKSPFPIWAFCLLNVVIPVSTGNLMSFNRFALMSFPLIIYFSKYIKTKKEFIVYSSLGILLQMVGIYMFINGVFAG